MKTLNDFKTALTKGSRWKVWDCHAHKELGEYEVEGTFVRGVVLNPLRGLAQTYIGFPREEDFRIVDDGKVAQILVEGLPVKEFHPVNPFMNQADEGWVV